MRVISKSVVITGAGAVLLGTCLVISSGGVVSGASQIYSSSGAAPAAKKSCDTVNYCLSEVNKNASGGAIYAQAANDALYVLATDNYGVVSTATNESILGAATNDYGVYGAAVNDYGVFGSATNYGVYGVSSGGGLGGIGVFADASNTGGAFPLWAQREGTGSGYFSVDSYGDGVFTGFVQAIGGYSTVMRMSDGSRADASVTLAPRATIEDTGTARMTDGVGVGSSPKRLCAVARHQPGLSGFPDSRRRYARPLRLAKI
jgi:hypothetical protein